MIGEVDFENYFLPLPLLISIIVFFEKTKRCHLYFILKYVVDIF